MKLILPVSIYCTSNRFLILIIKSNKIGLEKLGFRDIDNICYNFSSKALVEDIVKNGEGIVGMRGAAMVDTGIYTGRSPKDKYIVKMK